MPILSFIYFSRKAIFDFNLCIFEKKKLYNSETRSREQHFSIFTFHDTILPSKVIGCTKNVSKIDFFSTVNIGASKSKADLKFGFLAIDYSRFDTKTSS